MYLELIVESNKNFYSGEWKFWTFRVEKRKVGKKFKYFVEDIARPFEIYIDCWAEYSFGDIQKAMNYAIECFIKEINS